MRIKTEKLLQNAKNKIEEGYKKELEKREGGEFEEAEDSLVISALWWIAGFFLGIADVLEIVFDLLAVGTAGILFFLPYITLIFEIPGVLIFVYLIWHYIRNKVIGKIEGSIYVFIVCYELIVTFIPIVQVSDILPSKTLARLISRRRIRRLMEIRKKIHKKEKEGELALL